MMGSVRVVEEGVEAGVVAGDRDQDRLGLGMSVVWDPAVVKMPGSDRAPDMSRRREHGVELRLSYGVHGVEVETERGR